MHGFFRVFKLALRFRFTIVGVVSTALLLGIMWGANISVVYPFIKVMVYGKTMQEWIRDEIADCELRIESSQRKALAFEIRAKKAELPATERERAKHALIREREIATGFAKQLATTRRIQPYIERYAPETAFRTVLYLVGMLLAGSLIKDGFFVANMLLVERLVQLVMFDLRKQFYRQTLRLDTAALGEHSSSELLASFTNDITCLAISLNNLLGKALREPLRMIACLVGAAIVSWQLLLFSLLIAPPCLYLMKCLSKSLKRNSRRALTEIAALFNRLTETFAGMQTVKAFTMEQYERARFHETTKAIYRTSMRVCLYTSLTKPVTELFGIGVIAIALVAGSFLVLNQETHILGVKMCDRPLTAPGLMLFFGMLAGVSDPARKMSEIFGVLAAGAAASDRLLPLLDREPTIVDPVQPESPPRPHRELVFDQVNFAYQPTHPVLRGIDLKIAFGETVAIVGPNGCGKSTLINLLLRFYDPDQGSIRMDGVNLRQMRLKDLRERIGIVSQLTHLFDDTVANNIRYGSPHATNEQVMAAARQAHAHRFIEEKLRDGYHTEVGQGGSRLSGGQRQRIALARAILRDPEILVLDEATSQIDVESEQAIHKALAEFVQGRTAIMITHRLSTLTLAHRIIVMDAGQIIDVGTHQELMNRCSVYQRLHEPQLRQSA
jgi:ATP-binding cassette subfamily B protein/subfamily B ATP-binding cassette protein MsbA